MKTIRLTVDIALDKTVLDVNNLTEHDVIRALQLRKYGTHDTVEIVAPLHGAHDFIRGCNIVNASLVFSNPKLDGKDAAREMIRDDIEINGKRYGLTADEIGVLINQENDVVNTLAETALSYIKKGMADHDAITAAHDELFSALLANFRAKAVLERAAHENK